MTTEDLLWNTRFEQEDEINLNEYNYDEERAIEFYYEDKELFERFDTFFKVAS